MRRLLLTLSVSLWSVTASAQGIPCEAHLGRPPAGPISAVCFVDAARHDDILVAVAGDHVVRSDDGGRSWVNVAEVEVDAEEGESTDSDDEGDEADEGLAAMVSCSGDVVAVCRGTQLLLSDDAGLSFVSYDLPLAATPVTMSLTQQGARLLVGHGAAVARLEVAAGGVRLVDDQVAPAEVARLAAGAGRVVVSTSTNTGALWSLDRAGQFHRLSWSPPPGRAVQDVAVDRSGDVWCLTDDGIYACGADEGTSSLIMPGASTGATAIAAGRGDTLYLVTGGELSSLDLVCDRVGQLVPWTRRALDRRERTRHAVLRGLLPELSFEVSTGAGRLGATVLLRWPLALPDTADTEDWRSLRRERALEHQGLEALEVRAIRAWRTRAGALEVPVSEARDVDVLRAVEALRARDEASLIETMWP